MNGDLAALVRHLRKTDQYPGFYAAPHMPAGTEAAFEARVRMLRHLVKRRRRPSCAWMLRVVEGIHRVNRQRAELDAPFSASNCRRDLAQIVRWIAWAERNPDGLKTHYPRAGGWWLEALGGRVRMMQAILRQGRVLSTRDFLALIERIHLVHRARAHRHTEARLASAKGGAA